ncbi:MAG: glycosyltransferase family 4 protein [candidate division WS1 bacterium]|nr:glycosyltransferase family 4 protein [candidate division WS1 bacterium]
MTADAHYRIAYIDTASDLGGAEKSLLELTARLDTSRFTPLLLHSRGAGWMKREDTGHLQKIPVFSPGGVMDRQRDRVGSKTLRNLQDMLASARPVYRVMRGLRNGRADLVHTNTLKGHLLGGLAARLARLPLIWHVRDLLEEGQGRALLLQAARTLRPRVIAISEAVARQFDGLSLRVDLIPNGVPLERFTPGEAPESLREEWSLRPEECVIVCVGRLTPWKGHRTLLRAFAEVLQECPECHLLVVGEVAFWSQEYGQELHELAERLELGDRLIWTGFRPEIPEILRLSDFLVLPSRDEPFGRVLVEAMAVGKPVIATSSGGAPEIVLPEETGLLVPPEDPEALAEAMVRMAKGSDLRQKWGQTGLERAAQHFDVRRVVAQVQGVYEEMLNGGT